MAYPVAVQTVAVTSSGAAITITAATATGLEYFFFEASNASTTVNAFVNFRNRAGALVPSTAAVSGSMVPMGGATYVSPKLKCSDYANGGPVLYAASNLNTYVTVFPCADGDEG